MLPFIALGMAGCFMKILKISYCCSLSLSMITIGSALSGTCSSTIGAGFSGFLNEPKSSLILFSVYFTSTLPTTMIAWFVG